MKSLRKPHFSQTLFRGRAHAREAKRAKCFFLPIPSNQNLIELANHDNSAHGFTFSDVSLAFLLSLIRNSSVRKRLVSSVEKEKKLYSAKVQLLADNSFSGNIINVGYSGAGVKANMDKAKIVVVGAGLIGLSTAVCISDSITNCRVSVMADRFSPNTTSDVAAGMLIPHLYPGTPVHQQKQWFRETFDHLLSICDSSEASEAGIHLVSGWQIFKAIPEEKIPFWSDVVLGFRSMTEKELKKFPQHKYGQAFTTLKCDCPSYLIWLEKRLKENGGQVHARKIEDLWELYRDFDIVVNCSGIGSRKLAGDLEVHPIRGQVLKVHAPWIKHFIRDGDGLTYIYPGIHNVTLDLEVALSERPKCNLEGTMWVQASFGVSLDQHGLPASLPAEKMSKRYQKNAAAAAAAVSPYFHLSQESSF
ncbi:D-aspartate oxidase [Crotalus adamanteus]|uniref:D-aspartate oxidase n=1 Tax=Crotalus adamanteus TaxID=8729 RepID=A0AAW1CAX5_CROAD